jgi:hypothetical protein
VATENGEALGGQKRILVLTDADTAEMMGIASAGLG